MLYVCMYKYTIYIYIYMCACVCTCMCIYLTCIFSSFFYLTCVIRVKSMALRLKSLAVLIWGDHSWCFNHQPLTIIGEAGKTHWNRNRQKSCVSICHHLSSSIICFTWESSPPNVQHPAETWFSRNYTRLGPSRCSILSSYLHLITNYHIHPYSLGLKPFNYLWWRQSLVMSSWINQPTRSGKLFAI